MKISLILTGKTTEEYIQNGCKMYDSRINRYLPFAQVVVAAEGAKGLPPLTVNQREATNQLKAIESVDYLILLDENGREHTSVEFANFLQQRMNQGIRHLAFMVGGAYGFDEVIRKKAHYQLSLSKMTFPHQLIRLLFMEQLYRGFSILRNEPYHHA